jgi:DNA-binding CsgD family transcriptional regulator
MNCLNSNATAAITLGRREVQPSQSAPNAKALTGRPQRKSGRRSKYKEKVLCLLSQGLSPKEIKKQLGCSGGIISTYREQLGIKPFARVRPIGIVDALRQSQICSLRTAGVSIKEIARQMGLSYQRIGQLLNPEKRRSRALARAAVKKGILVQPDLCEGCASKTRRTEMHHPDYSKPLEVQWLCKKCHVAETQKINQNSSGQTYS